MRELKFRGTSFITGKVIYGDLIQSHGMAWIRDRSDSSFINPRAWGYSYTDWRCAKVMPETIGQYVQRVNGHEIFTKDIVKAFKHGDTDSTPFIYEITERAGTYWFGNWTWLEFLNIFRYVEVIGTSHTNPELLEVRSEKNI